MTKIIARTDRNTLFVTSTQGEAAKQSLHTFPLSGCHFVLTQHEVYGSAYCLESLASPGPSYVIANFPHEHEAVAALRQIEKTLHRRCIQNRTSGFLRLIFWPGALLMSVLAATVSLNGAVMNLAGSHGAQPAAYSAPVGIQQPVSQQQPAQQPQMAPGFQQESAPRAPTRLNDDDLLSLKQAVKNGHFTVSLSQGHARTLYVFSDPLCPHCRSLEPRLEEISKSYNVEIFPVSVFGMERSAPRAAAVLDAEKASRTKIWMETMTTGNYQPMDGQGPAAGGQQGQGNMLVQANDVAFTKFGFIGTPTIVTDQGKLVPVAAVRDDARLQQFFDDK